jgi:hypothetical protein
MMKKYKRVLFWGWDEKEIAALSKEAEKYQMKLVSVGDTFELEDSIKRGDFLVVSGQAFDERASLVGNVIEWHKRAIVHILARLNGDPPNEIENWLLLFMPGVAEIAYEPEEAFLEASGKLDPEGLMERRTGKKRLTAWEGFYRRIERLWQ